MLDACQNLDNCELHVIPEFQYNFPNNNKVILTNGELKQK